MTEPEFWRALEFRACRELERLRDNRLRFLWCDGFLPDDYQPDADAIVGCAFISEDDGRTFQQYRFKVDLPSARRQQDGFDWSAVLPQDATNWLTISRDAKQIEIRPR